MNFFRDWIKRPKSTNASASQPNSSRVSVFSASGAHDLALENDAGSTEPIASWKYIVVILVTTELQPPSR